jgi:hypothetical protein
MSSPLNFHVQGMGNSIKWFVDERLFLVFSFLSFDAQMRDFSSTMFVLLSLLG